MEVSVGNLEFLNREEHCNSFMAHIVTYRLTSSILFCYGGTRSFLLSNLSRPIDTISP